MVLAPACRSVLEVQVKLPAQQKRVGTMSMARGFTLIEMLVVMLVMGLLVGLVRTIGQTDDKTLLRFEAERLAQLMDLAATKSRLTGKSISWTTSGKEYRFWQLSEASGWDLIEEDGSLRVRILPTGMTLSNIYIEGARSPESMRIEFSPYGSMLAYSMDMSLGTALCKVVSSPIGAVYISTAAG